MIVHSVYFWVKKGIEEKQKQALKKALLKLGEVSTVSSIKVGVPAHSLKKREVTDRSFDFSLILEFSNAENHNAYQKSDYHQKFVLENSNFWQKVKVYDIETNE